MFFALGLGALSGNRLQLLGHLLSTEIPHPHDETRTVAQLLPPNCMFENFGGGQKVMQVLEGMKGRHTPLSDWIQATLRQYMSNTIFNSKQYDLVFDKLEILMALSYARHDDEKAGPWSRYWIPLGSFVHRSRSRERVIGEMEESISTLQHESPFVRSGIFGETPEECAVSIQQFKAFVRTVAQELGIFY